MNHPSPIECSLYEGGLTDTTPTPYTFPTWEAFVAALGTHRPGLRKEDFALFSPHRLKPGTSVGNANVVSAGPLMVFDLDDLSAVDFQRICARVEELKIPYVIASSWKWDPSARSKDHPDGRIRVRLVTLLSRSLLPSEWKRAWQAANESICFGLGDKQCSSVAHRYYVPSAPEGGPQPFYATSAGEQPFDIDEHVASHHARGGTGPSQLRALARRYRARGEPGAALATQLCAVADGEAFAEVGGRDTALFALCCALVDAFPATGTDELGALFAQSLAMMGEDAPTVAAATEKIDRIRRARQSERTRLVERAVGRPDGYTDAELDTFADQLGMTLRELEGCWIIQKHRSYYFLVAGEYDGPWTSEEASNKARELLSPARHIDFDVPQKSGGSRPKSIDMLVREHGTAAKRLRLSLVEQRSRFDLESNTLIEAHGGRRELSPLYDEDVQKWLTLLGGTSAIQLMHWVSQLVDLTAPAPALFLTGAPNVGKSLLGMGLGRVYSRGAPPTFDEINSDFNDRFLECPFIFTDEASGAITRSGNRTAQLRSAIQATTRSVRRKYAPAATVDGALRFLFAANSHSFFEFPDEALNAHDQEAIAERFLLLDAPVAAANHLKGLDHSRVQSWVSDDVLARHALHLANNAQFASQGRFTVGADSKKVANKLAVSGSTRAQVCEWVVRAVLRGPRDSRGVHDARPCPIASQGLRVVDRAIHVHGPSVHDGWRLFIDQSYSREPTMTAVTKALSALALRSRNLRRSGVQTKYQVLRLDALAQFAVDNDFVPALDEFEQAARRLDESTAAPPAKCLSPGARPPWVGRDSS